MNEKWMFRVGVVTALVSCLVLGTLAYTEVEAREQRIQTLFDQGIGFYHQKEYETALARLDLIPLEMVDDWRIPYYKASSLVQLKRYEEAAPLLERARMLNQSEAKIPFALGVVYYKLGKLELAKGYFSSTVRLDPDHEHAKGLVDVIARLERYNEPSVVEGVATGSE